MEPVFNRNLSLAENSNNPVGVESKGTNFKIVYEMELH